MKLFRIYDSKAKAYLPSWSSQTAGTAIRAFEAAAKDEQSDFNRYAADYTLMEVGSECDETGVLIPATAGFINLGTALQFLQQESFPVGTKQPNGGTHFLPGEELKKDFLEGRGISPTNLKLEE